MIYFLLRMAVDTTQTGSLAAFWDVKDLVFRTQALIHLDIMCPCLLVTSGSFEIGVYMNNYLFYSRRWLVSMVLLSSIFGFYVWRINARHAPISLNSSAESIRHQLLEYIPIGSTSLVATKWLTANDVQFTTHATGFWKQDESPPKIIGVRSLRCLLGETKIKLVFTQSVTAFFGYDEGDHLIDVWVWKTTDAL